MDDMDTAIRKIAIYSRKNLPNYGDPIIGDCCKYLIEKTASENNISIEVKIVDIYKYFKLFRKYNVSHYDTFVFPGGGINELDFCRIILKHLSEIEKKPDKAVFFNAIGIKPGAKKPIRTYWDEMFHKECVRQITTRGSLKSLMKNVPSEMAFPPTLVFDPAVWVNEAYGITRNADSEIIGVGVIHADIYELHKIDLSEEQVYQLYENILRELDRRGYRWQLFTNGLRSDYRAGIHILKRMGLDKKTYMGPNVKNSRELVKKISGYGAVIAARLHANILATSLDIPSIGLVWNPKMNLFADILGCRERYINGEDLLNAKLIVDRMEQARKEGYNKERIDTMKKITIDTIKNILQ